MGTENFTTTFWSDFSIADRFGLNAVKDTFRRAFREWKGNYLYLTDLVLTLNHKIYDHYTAGMERYADFTTICGKRQIPTQARTLPEPKGTIFVE